VPTTLAHTPRFEVTGVDLSARPIALAQRNVPRVTVEQADKTRFSCSPASFDARVAFYGRTQSSLANMVAGSCKIVLQLPAKTLYTLASSSSGKRS